MSENAAQKARRLLTEARVRVLEANEDAGHLTAEVRGDSSAVYIVSHGDGGWACSCPTRPNAVCSHVRAVMLITVMQPRTRP